jgi:hypothetical protein
MTTKVPEGTLCDHCHKPESPLTESNSAHLCQKDRDGSEITFANVHKECADAWAHANGGVVVPDEPLPPRSLC